VWLAEIDGHVAGHLVLTFCHSMEYGGRSAFIDDLFVRPELRNRGVGRALVGHARSVCEELGVRAMHLESGADQRAGTGGLPKDRVREH
jgi:GNAT superfamily N-acetyltransferase